MIWPIPNSHFCGKQKAGACPLLGQKPRPPVFPVSADYVLPYLVERD
jgi:hypothetical protein